MKRMALFGCKTTTLFLLDALRQEHEIACVITISPEAGRRNQVADYKDMRRICAERGIPCYTAERYDLNSQEDRLAIAELKLDVAFVVGWQRLVPQTVLKTFTIGVFGMHGSADDLPIGRGRSPMNWALIERRNHFFTNLFKYDPGVDSGDILDTFAFSIQPEDTAETMHFKNVLAMKTLILKNLDRLLSGDFTLRGQRELPPTYYPKRSPRDSQLDWHQDIFQLTAFIRAVTRPFNGAYTYLDGEKLRIWRAALFDSDLVDYGYRALEWGTVVEVFPNGKFLVHCRGGLLLVHEYECTAPVQSGSLLRMGGKGTKPFRRNLYGYHDLSE